MGSQKPGELMQSTLGLRYKGEGGVAGLTKLEYKPASPKGYWNVSPFSNEDTRRQPAGDKRVAPPTGVLENNKHKHALETDTLLPSVPGS